MVTIKVDGYPHWVISTGRVASDGTAMVTLKRKWDGKVITRRLEVTW